MKLNESYLTARIVKLKDAKGVIRKHIAKKNRQHYGKKKYIRTNNELQSIHIKLKTEYHVPY